MIRILLVEDDARLAEGLTRLLAREGHKVTHVASLASARAMGTGHSANDDYDLIILDWNLPDGQGIDLLDDARSNGGGPPVLMLTAHAELPHRVRGLDAGAVDYVVKPFEPEEFLARVRVQCRKRGSASVDAGTPTQAAMGRSVAQPWVEGRFEIDGPVT